MPDGTLELMLSDESYGLGIEEDVANYFKWFTMCSEDEYQANEMKLELLTYFNLTRPQVDDAQFSFCDIVPDFERVAQNLCATSGCTQNQFAFWQWATSKFTIDNLEGALSIVTQTDTVLGYPEIHYFIEELFKKVTTQ